MAPKSRSVAGIRGQSANDAQSLVAIAMDKPVINQATTDPTPTPKVAAAPVAQVANDDLSVSNVTNIGTTVDTEDPAISALRFALQAAGVETSGMHMEVHNNTISYMMGSYQDRQLVVQLAGGRMASYSADLVAKNANVTVTEMKTEHMV